jgi:hypothetical protein
VIAQARKSSFADRFYCHNGNYDFFGQALSFQQEN